MNIAWPRDIREFIDELIASGRYEYEGQILLEAMYLLRDRELLRKAKTKELRKELQKGIDEANQGKLIPGEEVFRELRKLCEGYLEKQP